MLSPSTILITAPSSVSYFRQVLPLPGNRLLTFNTLIEDGAAWDRQHVAKEQAIV
jgi:hypothetical protein